MKYNDVMAAFDSLAATEKMRFLTEARTMMAMDNASLKFGAKVQFKTKTGFIAGVFVRSKRKNAEVQSLYDRYGTKSRFGAVRWSVPLSGLVPLTPDQVKLYEFP